MAKEKTILVVDDEEFWRMKLSGYLSRRGLRVLRASSRTEAEDVLEEKKIDFVISDNRMETRDAGIGLCAWMRLEPEPLCTMPFILHTNDEVADVKSKIESLDAILCPKGDHDALMFAVDVLLRT